MTKKIIWRLKEQPTSKILQELVSTNILTKDEAREILFNETEESERSIESLKEEIKFLREVVDKLSVRDKIVEVVKEQHYSQPWYQPYYYWTTPIYCRTGGSTSVGNSVGTTTCASSNFASINTF